MSLPQWVQDAVEKGQDLSVCLELWKHATAVDRDERATQREEKKQEMELQRMAMEKDAEKQKLDVEREMEEKRLQVKMRELDLQEQAMKAKGKPGDSETREQKHEVKYLLPKYVEGEDIDVFIRPFERLANLHKWPKAEWAIRLVPQLTGKALDSYARLREVESNDYDVIKKAILKRYDLTASTYKDKFRACKQDPNETFREFYTRSLNYFEHWCQMERVGENFVVLVDVLMREQLINSSSKDLQVWLKERKPKSADEMIELAEAYQNAHRGSVIMNKVHAQGNPKDSRGKSHEQKPMSGNPQSKSEKKCFLCHRIGHFISKCPLRKSTDKDANGEKQWGGKPKPGQSQEKAGLVHSPTMTRKGQTLELPMAVEAKGFHKDTKKSGLKIESGMVNGKEASVLRDAGCTSILVAEKLIRRDDLTGGVSEVTLANGCLEKCPEVWIEVDTTYVKGKVVALVMNTPFADLIIGNYTRVDIPTERNDIEKMSTSVTDTCQAVETRSSAKRKPVQKEVVDIGQEFGGKYSREEWIEELRNDPTLDVYKKRVGDGTPKDGGGYISLEKGMLYRHFKSDATKEIVKQLLVPAKFRSRILSLAHDIPMAGHLGIKKTRERILKYFFWPGIFDDTKKYCRSCPKCQKGTSKTKVSKVPLIQIPRIDVPFQRIAIDMVGPLPRTKRGNQYVLVICD
ncbi:uncharacterized protein LOC125660258 [Ostrea edulis]|uniref:uncharacterized protein LOC125660258 n=1 Tax=Ostrea edulis TaxID=37623 RepID=UPI0024AF300C|nr:uncharacterized protein LOC125660258 [Ostrea edulis]